MISQSSLTSEKGARKTTKKVGRGNGSGKGTFCGRGMNGQNARSGGGVHPLFEGGQTAFHMRTPKLKGFKAHATKTYQVINLDDVVALVEAGKTIITKEILIEAGLVDSTKRLTKLLAFGKTPKTLEAEIQVDAASASAVKTMEKIGAKVVITK